MLIFRYGREDGKALGDQRGLEGCPSIHSDVGMGAQKAELPYIRSQ
jgi:hypothetical protein